MMRSAASGRRDRILAAIEVPALGVWLGALVGFAFISAPLAFRIVGPLDLSRFAALTAATIGQLTIWGYVLGGIAILAALARAVDAGDRTWDAVRIVLIAAALGLAAYEQQAIVPHMQAITDLRSDDYRALHGRSTAVYGAVALLVLMSLLLATTRREE
ncbi:MAG TPA: DUF4149 domain-containing protein [Candidatus Sulfotelmatobacter sp.]|nr:DUF4149 domain-containing protein [Candidatus Sulfotelmatobacter sp.]